MDAKIFGAFIMECRKAKNMTQADLAIKLNVTNQAVSRWERGVGFPDINIIEPLASALDLSILELMKSERIIPNEVTKEDAASVIMDTLNVAKIQHRQERRNVFRILGIVAVIVILILFLDSMQWQMDILIFMAVGVIFPLFCIVGFLALLAHAIWCKIIGKPFIQTFAMAFALLLLLVIFMGFFFLAGTLGLGPVPN